MSRVLTGLLVVGGLLGTSLSAGSGDSGPATYYSADYGPGDWLAICQQHAAWGNAAAPCVWSDYWCVHPAYAPGAWLTLTANGVTLQCEIGDTVAAGDEGEWWANGVVEVNWQAFVDLGLVSNNWVTVGWADTPDEPVEEPPAPETTRYFAETGYWLDEPFLSFWDAHGGLALFGYPLGGAYADGGMTVQYFERARFELHADCHCILLGRVGAEVLGQ